MSVIASYIVPENVETYIQRRPECCQAKGELSARIKVCCEQNHTRDETAFAGADQGAGHVKAGPIMDPCLAPS